MSSTIRSGKQVTLAADHDILLQGGQDSDSQHSNNSSSSFGVGLAIGLGSKSGFAGVNVNAAGSRGNSDGTDVTQTLSKVTAGGAVTLTTGNDATIKSAQVSGSQVIANIGNNLNIASVQDTSTYDSKNQSLSGSATIGPSSSASGSYAQSKVNADYASVGQQSGIEAGDGGFQINVKGNTDLQGGKISSTQAAIDSNRNSLTTGSLTSSDINNRSQYKAESISVSVGGSGSFGSSAGVGYSAGSDSSVTQSSISGGTININDQAQQAKNGQTAAQALANVDRSALTGKDGSNSLTKNWNGQQLQDEVTAQAQVTQAFGQQAAKAIGDYAQTKMEDLGKQLAQETDPAKQAALQADMDSWKEGGSSRALLHAAAGALSGGIGGALGAGASSLAMPEIAKAIDGMGLPDAVAKGLEQVTASALGAVVGGAAGAASGLNVEANNRQLTHSERDWAKRNVETYQQFRKDKNLESISDEEAYRLLLSAGYAIVDAAAEIGGKSDESAKQFIGLNKTKGLFFASPTERNNPSLNGNPDGSWTPEQQARFGANNPTNWANKNIANANLMVGQSCENAYACDTKVTTIVNAVEALEQKKLLYQDDPVQRQGIEAQQRALLNGMTPNDVELAKLAQADKSTLLEMLGMAGGPALVPSFAKSLAKLGANGANSVGDVAVTGEKLVSQNGTAINLPESASLSNAAARQWYLDQEAKIPGLIDTTTSLQDQAYQAFNLRNSFRTATRNAMTDQETAAQLNVTNPNLTWDQVVQKYSSTYSGDDLWTQIIGASQRSRTSVNQSLGVTPPKGK